ncbi:hypothetical protein CgunFtcFv8_024571 [Champsocephalus gunnari]|uniref:Uncharacterized protein n=1 Tax=Champsocephalus gunnari TaxID=52237 RepID=A0AAN8DER5_CHAGU|nr:hypothetical protein CgunFtcFv8_024571 [Champsocephalus gunnari]
MLSSRGDRKPLCNLVRFEIEAAMKPAGLNRSFRYIMTPDYVTTGIVSDWADHREIKDEGLIQRQLQVFFCRTVSSGV